MTPSHIYRVTHSVSFCYQASIPDVPDGGSGADGSGFGTLPSSGPLPPHLLVKQEIGMIDMFQHYSQVCIFPLIFKLAHTQI